MKARALLLAAPLALLPIRLAAQEAAPVPFQGRVEGRAVWKGTMRLTGDVEIPAGASLTVEAGTRILVAATDATRSGWNRDRVEIPVLGDLLVAGTSENPVRFEPEAGLKPVLPMEEMEKTWKGKDAAKALDRYPWYGIVLRASEGARTSREIRGALVAGAWSGVQMAAGRARLDGCVFLDCGTGLEAGSAYVDTTRYGADSGVARPVLTGCRFAGCGTGVFAERQGAPRLERCVVAHCLVGVGGDRATGRNFPLNEPGCTVSRCDLVGNGVGVLGPSLVTDSLFVRNRRAISLSAFHTSHGTGVDEVRLRGNAFAQNGAVLEGESLAGDSVLLESAGQAGDATALDAAVRAPWPAVPEGLSLRTDSPARGKASDGGDPGCRAPSLPGAGTLSWASTRTRLRRPLAALLPAVPAAGDEKGWSHLRPAPGASFRDSWWCRVEAGEDGALPLRSLAARDGSEVMLAFRVESSGGGAADLEVDGDLDALDAWWNEKPVEGIVCPRRFGGEGAVVPAALKSGANFLVLRVRGRGAAPRLGIALGPPAGCRVEEAALPREERAAKITEATVVREREKDGGTWLRLAVSTPLSWIVPGAVRLTGPGGEPVACPSARVVLEEKQTVKLGPLPADAATGATVLLSDFRAPDGAPVVFPAVPCPVPAAGGR